MTTAAAAGLGVILISAPGTAATAPSNCVTTVKSTVCLATPAVAEAYRKLTERTWSERATKIGYSFAAEADGTRIRVRLDDAAATDSLLRDLGDVVSVDRGDVTTFSGSRTNDVSPHFGGAAVGPKNAPTCSTGFSVVFPNWTRGSVTASHCWQSGQVLWSGNQFYGVVGDIKLFPTFDVVAIHNFGTAEDYTNVLHTGPGWPLVRTVIGAADPVKDALVCANGRVTQSTCAIKVDNTWTSFCPPAFPGCVENVLAMSRTYNGVKDVIGAKGDSGGTIYTPFASNRAIVNGMIVGGSSDGTILYAEKVSHIQSHIGATVLKES